MVLVANWKQESLELEFLELSAPALECLKFRSFNYFKSIRYLKLPGTKSEVLGDLKLTGSGFLIFGYLEWASTGSSIQEALVAFELVL